MDKSLSRRVGMAGQRSVLTRAERLQKLKQSDRWQDGQSPLGLPKVRVFKLALKKKKKKKAEDEDVEGTETKKEK
jgi:small basic protein (TIGR04137 family)